MEGEIRNREDGMNDDDEGDGLEQLLSKRNLRKMSLHQLHPTSIPLRDQISEVKRELAVRRRVYGKWIDSGKMTREQSHKQITTMEAILLTLEKVAHEASQQQLPFDSHNPPR